MRELATRRASGSSSFPFPRETFEDCIDKQKTKDKRFSEKKAKGARAGIFEEPTFPVPRQRFMAVVGEEERQFLLKGCYPAASIPFEARHGPDTSFNSAKWLVTVSRAEHGS